MQSVSRSELQADMERIFQQVEESGEALIITDAGRPALLVRPVEQTDEQAPSPGLTIEEAFADWRGKVVFHEDPNATNTGDWEDV